MSDLQCAARFVVLDEAGLGDVERLVGRLAGERIAAVYAAHPLVQDAAVTRLAERLGMRAAAVDGDLGVGGDGYEDLADRHRGETAVVVREGDSTEPVLLLVDADGFATQPFR
ncbi:MAG: hypothetical protein ACTHJJ_00295 [Intrasporangium sp.]|uniref:hypothetical protein n=1 Tax=Intrasporangium sp. TaxID=1925024 RepID=UPI003F7F86EE